MPCREADLKVWVVGSSVGELLPCLATFQPCSCGLSLALQAVSGFSGELHLDPCSQCLSLALQEVSGFGGELYLDPAHNACPWFSRK